MLDQMSQRLQACRTFEETIRRILADVVALHGAEFGNVQMPVGDGLVIVDQHGLDPAFLKAFAKVRSGDGCACGRALREDQSVVVSDIEEDQAYAPFRTAARRAGYRAVQSTPMRSTDGTLVGVVSTLFANAYRPTPIEMETVSRYARLAADRLSFWLQGQELSAKAQELHSRLYSELDVGEIAPAPGRNGQIPL
jgi:GAF domain-containing protein